ncbi:MAG: pyridoxal-phosphate dependent enzyme [Thermomicrobiales bacterium]|nr:pyridoxal-phosphate dependent enzyme [Thermomicrobiales bacterium]
MSATSSEPATDTRTAIAHLPVTIDDIRAARERIMPSLRRTPLIPSPALSAETGFDVAFKAENLQLTGSFKARGALNAIMQLTEEERARGVTTFSAGNHGAGLAFAASTVGAKCRVYMAKNAVPAKVDAIRGFGAEIVFGETIAEASELMKRAIAEEGLVFLSPFDDVAVVAGQGVVGLEILEDAPDVDAIVVPIGGGGLIAGIALAVKTLKPDVTIVGVEPTGAAVVSKSLASGRVERLDKVETIADGLAAPFAGEITQEIIAACVDRVVIVTDDEIAAAIGPVMSRTKLMPEPSGVAAFAALATGKTGIPAGSKVVCLLSGGNVGLDRLASFLG